MSGSTDRPRLSLFEFEERARHTDRAGEGARLELISGRPGEKAWPYGTRGRVIQWLSRVCLSQRPELWLDACQGLIVGASQEGRARPDGSLTSSHAFTGAGEGADPAPVLTVVEVTSYDSDTGRRDRVEKPRPYAGTGIPGCLLIDRDTCQVWGVSLGPCPGSRGPARTSAARSSAARAPPARHRFLEPT